MIARQEAPSRDLNEGSGSRFASSALTTIEGSERAKDVYQGLAMGILSSDVETKSLKKKKKDCVCRVGPASSRLFAGLCLEDFKHCTSN